MDGLMTRIKRVIVRGDNGNSPCVYRAVLENGMAVLSMWRVAEVTADCCTYERIG